MKAKPAPVTNSDGISGRICRNIYKIWTLGYYVENPGHYPAYQQYQGTYQQMKAKAIELGMTKVYHGMHDAVKTLTD